ncbi:MAG: alanine racemase [Clostridiales bacterium]|nr:alanine racemase [Clostridiales bacterium]
MSDKEIYPLDKDTLRKSKYYRVEADIDLDAIYDNIVNIKETLKNGTKLMVIVKADGYGHGAVPIAKKIDCLIDGYGIATVEEGISLRNAGINKSILILGYTCSQQYEEVVKYDITPSIFQYQAAAMLSKEATRQGKTVKIHIKIDTGMSRLGFSCNKESVEEIINISKLEGIEIEGIFSHFACADELNKDSTYEQLDKFLGLVQELERNNIYIPIKHISNSAGIIDIPKANLDLVRCGIATYGLYPSKDVNQRRVELKPSLSLKTHVSFVKSVEEGVGVSYGGTYITSKTTKIATIPVGYGDGYPRNLSSKGRVLIRGKSAPIIGRICMDQFMVDVSHIDIVEQGDVVTLIGRDKDEYISVEELADLSGTFNYEFICNLGKRIPRLYYSNNKLVDIREYIN